MRLAVGGYSGPRAVCGAVAQLANNAIQVNPAIRRMDVFVSSCFISGWRVQTVAMIGEKAILRAASFLMRLLGYICIVEKSRASLDTAVQLIKQSAQESSDFALE